MSYLILDNGADSIKIGYSNEETCRLFPNCVSKSKNDRRRLLISNQYEELKDYSGLYYLRPVKKGYPLDFDLQSKIWDYVFSKSNVDYENTTLIFTDTLLNMPAAFSGLNEIFFEEYEFSALCRCNSTWLSNYAHLHKHKEEKSCLVVDSGFSSTTVAPYLNGDPVVNSMKRIYIGGKLLTNYFKDAISYRQMNVMNETYVINQVKEDVCFVSLDTNKDIEEAHKKIPESTIACEYVLPDFANIHRGYIKTREKPSRSKDQQQTLRLTNERFRVPEILFNPSDVFIKRMGVSELINVTIKSFPLDVQPHLYRNILLTGGNTLFPNFQKRVEQDCRSAAPEIMKVRVKHAENPIGHAWSGGALLARSERDMLEMVVTKAEYAEHGNRICTQRFNAVLHPS